MSHRSPTFLKPPRRYTLGGVTASLVFSLLPPLGAQPAPANVQVAAASEDGRAYSTIRMLDGDASLFAEDSDERLEVDVNYPIQTGDRLWVPPGSRVQLSMADGSLIAVGGGSEAVFDQIGGSIDSEDETTRVRLLQGRLHLTLDEYFVGSELPIVDTANARIFTQSERASFAVWANHSDWTQITVREGVGEVLTPSGSSLVRGDEELTVTGEYDVDVQLAAAARPQDLELWTSDSSVALARQSYDGLERPLAGTASLTEHGDWVDVDGGTAWRPRGVDDDWRPYSRGRWVTTRGGLFWSAFDPWSPVTFHYGGWDLHPRWGWLWHPGWRYAPAHVAWYFGPSYSAWVPLGYYNRFYGFNRLGFGFRYGLWGVGGGLWDPFFDWTFCPTPYFGYRRGARHFRSGRFYHRRGDRLGRGFITTDTRHVTRGHLDRPSKIYDDLSRRRGGGQLTDVTPLLARQKNIPDSVRRNVLVAGQTQSAPKVVRDSVRRDGIPRTSQTGVKRATMRRGIEGERNVTTRTKATSVRRTTGTTTQRAPSKVIVDGVRRGSGAETSTGRKSTSWRSSDRPTPRTTTTTTRSTRGTSKTVRSRPPVTTRSTDRTQAPSRRAPTSTRGSGGSVTRAPVRTKPTTSQRPTTTTRRPPATTTRSGTRPSGSVSRAPARSKPSTSTRTTTSRRPPASSTRSGSSRGPVSRSSVRSGSSSRSPRASRPSGSSSSRRSVRSAPRSSSSGSKASRSSSSSSRSSRSSVRSSGSRSSSKSSARSSSSRSSSSRSKSGGSSTRSRSGKPPSSR